MQELTICSFQAGMCLRKGRHASGWPASTMYSENTMWIGASSASLERCLENARTVLRQRYAKLDLCDIFKTAFT